jgi:subtilisin family serine protease
MKRSAWFSTLVIAAIIVMVAGCSDQSPTGSSPTPESNATHQASLSKGAAGGRVFVLFRERANADVVRATGARVIYTYKIVPAVAAEAGPEIASQLSANPGVVLVEPDVEVQKSDAELDNTWGVKRIGAGNVQARGNTGAGVKVGVLDTGIDYTHPDLSANYAGGYDFVNHDNDPMDDEGHGTHVSGTIAARKDGQGVVGVAPNARVYALKVLGSTGSGSFSDVIAALDWCVSNGIQVTNNSYGSSSNPGVTVQTAFDNATAAGIINIAAAGNSGNAAGKNNSVGYPAAYSSVIAVAATDNNNNRASFSSTGPAVEIAAPGVSILSTKLGGGYVSFSGTSMATPHVVGTAALVIAAGITNVRAQLQATATDLGAAGRDTWYGYGLVNADLAAPGSPTTTPNTAPTVSISGPADNSQFTSGSSITFTGTASDTPDGNLTGSLSWSSNRDGTIGSGGSFPTSSLSVGTHTITASVTDAGGLSGSASITVTINSAPPPPPPNTAPVVSISSPANNSSFAKNTAISFSGSASDAEDGSITSNLVWTSYKNGSTTGQIIGTGGSFSAKLTPGSYVITASVSDSAGASNSASIKITVK